MTENKSLKPYFLITLLSAILFIPFLGKVHLFDWDEINFAESAREMIVTGNYSRVMIDYQAFWEKPPLFFWMQATSMKIFGINEFAARFPNAICGIITLCLIFFLGKKYFDETFGWLWVIAYIGSFLPHFYFKSGIIDPWFNLFIFSGIAFLVLASEQVNSSVKQFAISGIFIGLAILTKGPVAFLIIFFTGFIFLYLSKTKWVSVKSAVIFLLSMIAIRSLWMGIEVINNGTGLIKEFIEYQVRLFASKGAGHGGPFYYHAVVLILGCFPASILALNNFFSKHDAETSQFHFRRWMIILFMIVLILFSIVRTKIIHYSSLCYLPLTFLAAWEIYFGMKTRVKISKVLIIVLAVIGILIGIAAALLPYLGAHADLIFPYIEDSFARANLEAIVDWPPQLMLIGISYGILSVISTIWIFRNLKRGAVLLFVSTCIFIQAIMFSFVPRIEQYTQGAIIDFYKTLQDQDVYIEVLGFKSFAHLFYSRRMPNENSDSLNKEWLLKGEIDKPAYFVCKIIKADEYRALLQLQEISNKNGYVIFKRETRQEFR